MESKRNSKSKLIIVIVVLLLINCVALILSDCNAKGFISNMALYVVEIFITIWLVKEKDVFKSKYPERYIVKVEHL